MPEPRIAALIVAAGRGQRVGGERPKQYQSLAGRAVLAWSLEAFLRHPRVSTTRVVIHGADRSLYDAALEGLTPGAPIAGGAERQESVRLGLEALSADAPDLVLIHDAARPFVPPTLIDRVIDALAHVDGAVPALPLSDTIKQIVPPLLGTATIRATIPRDTLYRAQTPQGFRYAAIRAAHARAQGQALTDDAAVAEAAGQTVVVVPGEEGTMKITEAKDFERAAAWLGGANTVGEETSVGMGFDVHRFEPGDHVMLCGVRVPHSHGLEGHSDADAGLHALTDALLGAIGAGDIGVHFPPSDPQWRGASSDRFLAHAAGLVRAAGGTIVNVDVTIICERPKIGPHRAAMVQRMAEILGIDPQGVSVKATTTEGLGFTGRREGLAAQAIASVRRPRRS